MSKISLKHSGGNVVSLNSPTSAPTSADVAFKLPNADGSAGQFMKTDGSGNLSFGAGSTATSKRTLGSSTTLSNQASVDYTGFGTITRFDIHFNAVSCNSSSEFGIRIGSGGSAATSGYLAQSAYVRGSDNVGEAQTAGFFSHGLADASYSTNGILRCFRLDATQHKWYCIADFTEYNSQNHWFYIKGYRTLGGSLDVITVLPESGTFDSGNLRLVTYSD